MSPLIFLEVYNKRYMKSKQIHNSLIIVQSFSQVAGVTAIIFPVGRVSDRPIAGNWDG
jgi:hypothetical protein